MKDSKKIRLQIGSIVKKMDRHAINFDHPLQRASEQWSCVMKGNLISDILQENPIPDLVFAEQEIHGAPVTWGIDGKQRCTNIKDFINNGYSISKNVDRYMIKYAVPVLDEDGIQKRDEDGIVIHKAEVCDIRGKKYKNLPKELQERILDYGLDIVLYYDCSEENLAYHIKRYNEGRAMNAEQKGITRIGTHFASVVRNISSMAFFEDGIGNYTDGQFKNGKINRIIVESVMTTRFLNEWAKDFGDNCDYIKNNATNEDFEEFRGLVESLEDIVEPVVGKMFDSKDSFLWFGLYSKFTKLDINEDKFNEFMLKINDGIVRDKRGNISKTEPMTGICTVEIDGTTLEELLKNSSTKDVNIVKTKIDFLTKLMCSYFGVEVPEDEDNGDNMNEELTEFAEDFGNRDIAIEALMLTTDKHSYNDFKPETISNMIKWYKQHGNKTMLKDCLSYKSYLEDVGIKETDINLPLYVFGVKYIFDNDIDIDIDEWLAVFKKTAFIEIDKDDSNIFEDNSTIVMKQQEVISNINQFITKEKY